MEYDRRRVKILLNRANTNVGIEREDVLAILGRDVDILVPSSREITKSVNQGQPIALQRNTEAAKAFRALAEMYIEEARQRAAEDGMAPVIELPTAGSEPAVPQGRQSIFRRKRSA
jgi:septum formation inhibitor-activating ATPase MinD